MDVNALEKDRWTGLHLASSEEHLNTLALTLRVVALTALALTLHVIALTALALRPLTPCVVALTAHPHTTSLDVIEPKSCIILCLCSRIITRIYMLNPSRVI